MGDEIFFSFRISDGTRRAGSSFHRSLFKVSWLCMVTRSKSYVHSWHFVIIVRPIRQEIVHHARTYGGRVKGNESPSSLGSLAFPAMLSVYTPSVFPSFPRLETVNSSRANIFHRFLRSHWKRSIFTLQCTKGTIDVYVAKLRMWTDFRCNLLWRIVEYIFVSSYL